MAQHMRRSVWLLLISLAAGAAVAGAVWRWVWSDMAWWAYVVIAFISAAGVYSPLVRTTAAEKILDRD